MDALYHELRELLGDADVKRREPMKRHTTFRIGGPAQIFAAPRTEDQLIRSIKLCRERGIPWYVIGNGSNLLVDDQGVRGVILSTEMLDDLDVEGETIRALAGVRLSRLARAAAQNSLTGFEFAAGIPGTLGGAVVMNAGAYGSEMKEVLLWARVLDRQGRVRKLDAKELKLGYRTSAVESEGYVVLETGIGLRRGEQSQICGRMEELAKKRQEKQPLEYPSAGSTFKRPEGYFAGKLIDDAGLRGYRIGDAQISEKHCGFVINRGSATGADVLALCEEVRRRVKERFGVELEMEVRRL